MKGRKSIVNLFEYLDYRVYLRDLYNASKKERGSFSFRTFSKKAGFHSPNFLKLVMDGKRNLTLESLPPFMKGLDLNKQEREFFRNLVFYNQADQNEKKAYYYQQILRSRKFKELKPIEKNQYEYCSEWHHSVVREMVTAKNFDGTPEWISARIFPPITPAQAKKSMEILSTLGFISKTKDGLWRQSSSLVSTGAEVQSVALFNYHLNLIELTKKALETIPAEKRDISSLTLGVVRERIPELKKKIQEFRQEIMKMVSVDSSPEAVVQLSIQMFPMTQILEGERT